jgi:phosphohistidine phosphatase
LAKECLTCHLDSGFLLFVTFQGPFLLRLLLLRHAKSDWSKDADDHGRPLSARGRKSAPDMARYMRSKDYLPGVVLCSTAQRTRETLDLLLTVWSERPVIRYENALYLADWPVLLANLKKAPARASPLLLVGHNPGMEQLAVALALQSSGVAERARLQRLTRKFPTAALAVLDFDITSWRNLKPGLGKLVEFVRPKDLAGESAGDDS